MLIRNNAQGNEMIAKNQKEVLELCRKKKGIPVNVVGVGRYFEEKLARYLLAIASETGGAFNGR